MSPVPRSRAKRNADTLVLLRTEDDCWMASADETGNAHLVPLSDYWHGAAARARDVALVGRTLAQARFGRAVAYHLLRSQQRTIEFPTRGAIVLDEPREFPQYGPHCFATYWLDPHGIKLEAVCHRPEES